MPSTAVMCCCSRVRGAGVAGTPDGPGVEGPARAFVAAAETGAVGGDRGFTGATACIGAGNEPGSARLDGPGSA